MRASGQCVDESPIPPVVPPTTWTAWYSVDDPMDGTENETLLAIRDIYPSVCTNPTLTECRVRFIHTDSVSKGQVLMNSCTPTAGLLCQESDQPNQEVCLDYEIRFECPSPSDTLPEPHFHWDMSTKTSVDDDEPLTCNNATVTSIYPNIGGMTGTVNQGALEAADAYDSSDHLCAVRISEPQHTGWVVYGSAAGKCISSTVCCTSGWTFAFWMRYRSTPSSTTRNVFTSGGYSSTSRGGLNVYLTRKFGLMVRGALGGKSWEMKMLGASTFPPEAWTHHCFTYDLVEGTKYFKNGDLLYSLVPPVIYSPSQDIDDVIMFAPTSAGTANFPEGDFSDVKMFYRTFNDTEVQKLYSKDTSESTLLIHYLRKLSHSDSFDVEIECLAKAGRSPNITWYRSDDGDHFSVVSPSSGEVAIFESSPNSYRRRSLLMVRGLSFATDVIFVCEALDGRTGGAVSKIVTIPKRNMYWTPWLSADDPADGDDVETLTTHKQVYDLLCNIPSDIQCRTLYDDVSSNQTGQILDINCTVSSGLDCRGASQSIEDGRSCYDYEVRYSCPESINRWTDWYDTSDPTGSMENESLATHKLQSYPDLCTQPIGAECRIKGTNQDILDSGIIPEIPYLCNANGFRCQDANNTKPCPDVEVRYRCPTTSVTNLQVNSLQQISHHLDPNLRLQCDVTEGIPVSSSFSTEWLWLDRSQSQAAVPISPGGDITITPLTSQTSVLKIDDFASGGFTNRTLVCIARDGIVKDAKTIKTIKLPSACEAPIGISSGQIQLSQISPSSVKSEPFKIPSVNGVDAWVPAVNDTAPMLDFDLGVEYDITGIAVQGDPPTDSPTSMVTELDLYRRDIGSNTWTQPLHIVTAAFNGGQVSYNTLDPNVTTRFLRFYPTLWQGFEIMMKVEIYGCGVGESTLRILELTKTYDVITNNFTFTCRAEHYPVPNVTWLADNESLSAVEGVFQISEYDGVFPTKVSVLTLIGFQPANDSVEFSCQATAGADTAVERINTQCTTTTSALLTKLESSEGPADFLQTAIRSSNLSGIVGQDGELQDSEKENLQKFLKVIPTLPTQQLPASETRDASELVLQVYSKLTDPKERLSVEDHMSVSTDVEDAMEYLAGTLGQGNCTRATYDTTAPRRYTCPCGPQTERGSTGRIPPLPSLEEAKRPTSQHLGWPTGSRL
ncbi:uncharacterized protein [Asterias amurensis]|uniref:uncharacterized protein n=1 Tax=Asterias amurensis TaxID=7602 RepID=UPI003AB7A0C7